MLEKSEWQPWAQAWGLSHRPQKGKLVRDEGLIGTHRGYLLRVGWSGEYGADLVVLIRFPKTTRDPQSLKEQLLASPAISKIPGWKGKASGVIVDASGLSWTHSCSIKRPKTPELQGWVETILTRLAELTPGYAGLCEECQTSGVQKYVLINGVPAYICSGCQSRMLSEAEMHERKYDRTEANYMLGALYGAAGAVLGGVAWGVLSITTNRIFAAVAIGIAFMVAWAYARGAQKIDVIGKVIGAVLTLAGIALGDMIFFAHIVHQQQPEVPFHLMVGLEVFLHVLANSPRELAGEILFGLIGLWYVFKYLEKPKFKPTIEPAP